MIILDCMFLDFTLLLGLNGDISLLYTSLGHFLHYFVCFLLLISKHSRGKLLKVFFRISIPLHLEFLLPLLLLPMLFLSLLLVLLTFNQLFAFKFLPCSFVVCINAPAALIIVISIGPH